MASWSHVHPLRPAAGATRFAARFKDVIGRTPADYVTEWRLTIAQEELRAGKPVGTVAAELGYTSASAFSRSFAQRLGLAPRAWLAQAA